MMGRGADRYSLRCLCRFSEDTDVLGALRTDNAAPNASHAWSATAASGYRSGASTAPPYRLLR